MGNDNYTSVSKLQKAGNDATAMARELKAAGFTVQLHRDLNYLGMVKAVETFTNGITGGDEVVVFFAGHGVQIKNGSYLLPTDIEANSESQVEKTAYELLALTDKISEAKPAFSLVMVDACRDNPLKSKGRNIGNARGLSAIEPPKGQMVVYSASRGQQALDRLSDKDPNPNGVFTREFITQMKKPGVRIEDIMRSVQDSVETLAKSVSHEQRPAVYNEARGNFYFFGPTAVQVAPSVAAELTTSQREDGFWSDAKATGNKEAYEAYLESYPAGRYVNLAKAGIAKLTPPSIVTAISSTPSQTVNLNKRVRPINMPGDEETKKIHRLAFEQNDVDAQARLAVLYLKGEGGVSKNINEALRLLHISAEKNHVPALLALGLIYENGYETVSKDEVEAVKFYRLASISNPNAQTNLGKMYLNGKGGLPKNGIEAARLFQLADNQNYAPGQTMLGIMYMTGMGGFSKDLGLSVKLFKSAAAKSDGQGQTMLGMLYEFGLGLPKDEHEALKLYRLAAASNIDNAQLALGRMYESGAAGLEKNEATALNFYQLAAKNGNADAIEKIKKLSLDANRDNPFTFKVR